MGADVSDCRKVAELVGTKTFLNEFVAYSELGVFISNRKLLDEHVSRNGSWHWLDGDIIMTSSGANDTVLSGGVMSVSIKSDVSLYKFNLMLCCVGARLHPIAEILNHNCK